MTLLRGTVRSGKGNFSFWLAKLESYYTQKTGMKLYPGTLNIHLSDAIFPTPKDSIRLEKEEYGGRVSVSIPLAGYLAERLSSSGRTQIAENSVTRPRKSSRSQRISGSETPVGSKMGILSRWMSPDTAPPSARVISKARMIEIKTERYSKCGHWLEGLLCDI
jgi:hypothetical protein